MSAGTPARTRAGSHRNVRPNCDQGSIDVPWARSLPALNGRPFRIWSEAFGSFPRLRETTPPVHSGADLPQDLIGWSETLNRLIENRVRNQVNQSLSIRGPNPLFPARRANAAVTVVRQQAWQCGWQQRIVIDSGQGASVRGSKVASTPNLWMTPEGCALPVSESPPCGE